MWGDRERQFLADCIARMPLVAGELAALRRLGSTSFLPSPWVCEVVELLLQRQPVRLRCLVDLVEVAPWLDAVGRTLQACRDVGVPAAVIRLLAADVAIVAVADGSQDAPRLRQLLRSWEIGADYVNARVRCRVHNPTEEAACSP
jgi:hypothetical protein